MKFADCEVSIREKNAGKTFSEVKSLEMFESYAPNEGEKRFMFDQYEIKLRGISEDFKVLFVIHHIDGSTTERLVGEQVCGGTYNLDSATYDEMMGALKEYYITF